MVDAYMGKLEDSIVCLVALNNLMVISNEFKLFETLKHLKL